MDLTLVRLSIETVIVFLYNAVAITIGYRCGTMLTMTHNAIHVPAKASVTISAVPFYIRNAKK